MQDTLNTYKHKKIKIKDSYLTTGLPLRIRKSTGFCVLIGFTRADLCQRGISYNPVSVRLSQIGVL